MIINKYDHVILLYNCLKRGRAGGNVSERERETEKILPLACSVYSLYVCDLYIKTVVPSWGL